MDLPQCGGIDEVHMAVHQRGEGVLRMLSRILPQQIQVACHFQKYIAAARRNPTEKLQQPT